MDQRPADMSKARFETLLKEALKKEGRERLSDRDILYIACLRLKRTYTRMERGYR